MLKHVDDTSLATAEAASELHSSLLCLYQFTTVSSIAASSAVNSDTDKIGILDQV